MIYRQGRLVAVFLEWDSRFEISPRPDGPFLRLPCSKEEMLRVFGPPKRWSGYRRFTP